jgi:transposase
MITDNQVRKLKKDLIQGKTLEVSAARSGMDEKTARKYRGLNKLPSEIKAGRIRDWRTRGDSFREIWEEVKAFLNVNDGLEAKTLFQYLQREYPGRFSDGQLRTFQRRVKNWRAVEGPAREVYFPQKHKPGKLSQSDFTHMSDLGVTLGGVPFEHMVYHFVLTYSNWESCTVCFSESFESLSEGFQNSLWQLGGVPQQHQTDRLSAAVNKPDNLEEFTSRYQGVLDHYKLKGRRTNPARPNENGDVEQSHYRFKKAVDQALMLRGSRNFSSRREYEAFLQYLLKQLNQGRLSRFEEEQSLLHSLPSKRLDSCSRFDVRVGPSSTIRVKHNVYSVHSRLLKERVTVRLYADYLEVWYGQRCVENIPRLHGSSKHYIQYRHIIDWLVRKPGAFENYRYRSDLFPTSRFRIAYDSLCDRHAPAKASKEYLRILQLAARENETGVDDCLRCLIDNEERISADEVTDLLLSGRKLEVATAVAIDEVCLYDYDQLLVGTEVSG